MDDFSRDLADLLTVRNQGDDFVGDTEPYGVPDRLYGGHFLAQSLSAAFATVPEPKLAHSLHAYFHKTGDSHQPITYKVDILRDGRSFSTRRVTAYQKEEIVYSMSASFKLKDEDEFYQAPIEPFLSVEETIELKTSEGFPTGASGPPTAGGRVEIWNTNNAFKSLDLLAEGESRSVNFENWSRVPRDKPYSDRENQMLFAFVSDGPLPFCSAVLHGDLFGTHQHMSLDHSIWFHRLGDRRAWARFNSIAVATADGRGLNDGGFYNEAGELLMSVRQESLLRRLNS